MLSDVMFVAAERDQKVVPPQGKAAHKECDPQREIELLDGQL
jgi:hypothetical protein